METTDPRTIEIGKVILDEISLKLDNGEDFPEGYFDDLMRKAEGMLPKELQGKLECLIGLAEPSNRIVLGWRGIPVFSDVLDIALTQRAGKKIKSIFGGN